MVCEVSGDNEEEGIVISSYDGKEDMADSKSAAERRKGSNPFMSMKCSYGGMEYACGSEPHG